MYQHDDDRSETIKRHLDVYQGQTAPLAQYYDERGTLRRVDGDRPDDEVYADVKDGLIGRSS